MSLQLNGTDGVTFNDGSEQWAAASPIGPKNLIINGDMKIAQRGTSSTGQTVTGYKSCDRFLVNISSAGTWTITQDTDVPSGQGFSNSFKFACTTADTTLTGTHQIALDTRIEAQNVQHLKFGTSSAEKITLSYWVKSNKTGIHTAEIYQQDDDRAISKEITINSADTWEKKTWVIEGDETGVIDNNNGIGLIVKWWLGASSDFTSGTLATSWASRTNANRVSSSNINLADSTSNYLNITGVQLEVGDTATPFEHRPYDMELARCQRYYWKNEANNTSDILSGFGEIYNTDNGQVAFHLPVAMRVPYSSYSVEWSNVSATVPSTGNYTVSSIAIASGTYTTVLLNFVSTGMTAGKNPYLRTNSTSGYIAISGEL